MEKLRIDNGLKKIEVNDEGEYIYFSLNDTNFFSKYADLVTLMESKKGMYDELEDGETDHDKLVAIAKMRADTCAEVCGKIDEMFGENASKKVFGPIIPDEVLISEFFDAINPIIDKFSRERAQQINNKYNGRRKGANS